MSAPAGFDRYWAGIDDELANCPPRPVLETMPRHSTERFTVYGVRFSSIGPTRLFAYLSVPAGKGPFPGLLELPSYGSVNHLPDWHDRLRYVVLTAMHRGQRLADSPFAASYPGLLTTGIDDPGAYIYRGIAADCLRAAEVLAGLPEVDHDRIAVTGGDLAVVTAARRNVFTALRLQNLLLYRAMEARRTTEAYPLEELNDHLRWRPDDELAATRTLELFDPVHHAPAVGANVAVEIGEAGTTTSAEWLAPLLEALGGTVEQWPATHHGALDRNRMDAWLAAQLDAEPRSRFIENIDEWTLTPPR